MRKFLPGFRFRSLIGGVGVLLFLWATPVALALPIIETESDGTATNNTLGTAQAIPGVLFTTPVPLTLFSPPGFPTATVLGRGGADDVDFFSFPASGGKAYFDIDNTPFTFDTIVSLFDSTGTLLGSDDDSGPEDLGTEVPLDSFLGVITLPGPGTYFVAVSEFPNFPTAIDACTTFASLVRPDGQFGGEATSGCPAASSFEPSGLQPIGALPYTLHVSVESPTAVPEPASITLLGVGIPTLLGYGWFRRKSAA